MENAITATSIDAPLMALDAGGEPIFIHDGCEPAVMRARIDALKDRMLAATSERREMHVEHILVDGMYLRKLFIAKGTVLVGKIHLKACHNIVASGDISVLTELGATRIKAGATAASGRGVQKVGYAHEDTIFINVFRTDEVDIPSIEAEIAGELHVAVEVVASGVFLNAIERDRADYALFLDEFGLTESQVRAIVEDYSDHARTPELDYCLPTLAESPIHGLGTFAPRDFAPGDTVSIARVDGLRTRAGRMTNHSAKPNCEFMRLMSGDLLMVAIRQIASGEELTLNYRQAARVNAESGLVAIKGEPQCR